MYMGGSDYEEVDSCSGGMDRLHEFVATSAQAGNLGIVCLSCASLASLGCVLQAVKRGIARWLDVGDPAQYITTDSWRIP